MHWEILKFSHSQVTSSRGCCLGRVLPFSSSLCLVLIFVRAFTQTLKTWNGCLQMTPEEVWSRNLAPNFSTSLSLSPLGICLRSRGWGGRVFRRGWGWSTTTSPSAGSSSCGGWTSPCKWRMRDRFTYDNCINWSHQQHRMHAAFSRCKLHILNMKIRHKEVAWFAMIGVHNTNQKSFRLTS